MKNKELTTREAACIITGYGVGGGVLSMPYLAEKIGFINSLLVLVVAFAASYVLHLMIADLSMKTEVADFFTAATDFTRLRPEEVVDFRPTATYYGGRRYRKKKGSVAELAAMMLRPPHTI